MMVEVRPAIVQELMDKSAASTPSLTSKSARGDKLRAFFGHARSRERQQFKDSTRNEGGRTSESAAS